MRIRKIFKFYKFEKFFYQNEFGADIMENSIVIEIVKVKIFFVWNEDDFDE